MAGGNVFWTCLLLGRPAKYLLFERDLSEGIGCIGPLTRTAQMEAFVVPYGSGGDAMFRSRAASPHLARDVTAGWSRYCRGRCGRRKRRGRCCAEALTASIGNDRDAHAHGQADLRGLPGDPKKPAHRIIFMRHGECEWNRDNRFLGWADIGLTENGEIEARKAARTLAEFDIHVDEVFCSYLKRSIKSAWLLADEMDKAWMPIHTDWRLNEQMYGALQGLNKRATAERYGTELTQQWRRSYDIAPPAVPGGRGYFPVADVKYATLTEDDIPATWCGSPNTESLKDAQARSWTFWRERIVPCLQAGKTVLICGHGNIIRSMLKRLDGIPNDMLKQVSIPRATPLVYDLDENLMPVSNPGALGPISGRFLGNPLELAKALESESLHAQLGPARNDDPGTLPNLDKVYTKVGPADSA